MKRYPNIIQCLACTRILLSFRRHDFKTCGCPNETMIDGGREYLRYGGKNMKLIKVLKIVAAPRRKG